MPFVSSAGKKKNRSLVEAAANLIAVIATGAEIAIGTETEIETGTGTAIATKTDVIATEIAIDATATVIETGTVKETAEIETETGEIATGTDVGTARHPDVIVRGPQGATEIGTELRRGELVGNSLYCSLRSFIRTRYHFSSNSDDEAKNVQPNNTIMVRGLAQHITEAEIHDDINACGLIARDIRLIRKKETGNNCSIDSEPCLAGIF